MLVADPLQEHIRTRLARHPQAVIVYDNMNFKETVRDESLGHKAVMTAMTTAAVVICPEIPPEGLTQDMHNPLYKLDASDIVESPGLRNVALHREIVISLLITAVNKVHPGCIEKLFPPGDTQHTRPTLPKIQRLKPNKTEFYQLAGMFEDEGTINGTYGVHKNIFLDQLGLHAPADPTSSEPDDFKIPLRLVHGDQLSTVLNRGVKAAMKEMDRPYDQRLWLLCVAAWFHIQLNYQKTILETHFASPNGNVLSDQCLLSDAITWGIATRRKDSIKFHQGDILLRQSFSSRVMALFYTILKNRGMEDGHSAFVSQDEMKEIIFNMTPDDLRGILDEIYDTAFTKKAWAGVGGVNPEFTTMCRLLQEIALYLGVSEAIKKADIGLLRYFVDPLVVHFNGTKQKNYAREMIYYRWLLSDACTPTLQHAILSSGLVNWHGTSGKHKPIDLGMEHLNLAYKLEMKCFKNSTKDLDNIFGRIGLTNTWNRKHREVIEEALGERMSGEHTRKNTDAELFAHAIKLFKDRAVCPDRPIDPRVTPWESANIFSLGMKILYERVNQFNTGHIINEEQEQAQTDLEDINIQWDVEDLYSDGYMTDDILSDENDMY